MFSERNNRIRPHWALRPIDNEDPLTPADVYEYGCVVVIPKWQGWARAAAKKLKDVGYEPDDELEAVKSCRQKL